jgi:hypothetical protein
VTIILPNSYYSNFPALPEPLPPVNLTVIGRIPQYRAIKLLLVESKNSLSLHLVTGWLQLIVVIGAVNRILNLRETGHLPWHLFVETILNSLIIISLIIYFQTDLIIHTQYSHPEKKNAGLTVSVHTAWLQVTVRCVYSLYYKILTYE